MGHYSAFLALFGPVTFLQGVLFGGMVMAFVVTSSHQSEDLFAEHEPDWVSAQFRTTRDAEPGNPFSDWLWGGMQHQLEHHLFPTMPRYKYPALVGSGTRTHPPPHWHCQHRRPPKGGSGNARSRPPQGASAEAALASRLPPTCPPRSWVLPRRFR